MDALLILVLVALTSIGAYLGGTRWQRLPPGALQPALSRTLETLGVSLGFLVVNVALGILLILSWRALTGVFLSTYVIHDLTLVLLSVVQGLVYRWWHEGGSR